MSSSSPGPHNASITEERSKVCREGGSAVQFQSSPGPNASDVGLDFVATSEVVVSIFGFQAFPFAKDGRWRQWWRGHGGGGRAYSGP